MDQPLRQIGRYRILSELGRGAMGVVYGAEDPLLSRKVAIKTILLSADAAERAEYEPRFYQEAKAAGSLNHPNIITIHDIGREGDVAYMAMELLEGVELKSLVINGRLTLPLSLAIAAQVADGLAFAHQRGVVHRDIKPTNIMVMAGVHAKIMDFGIARLRTSDVKTQTGMLLGSPKYMSPEQIVGRALDHRSDIFSLGTVLYEMVTGVPPFAGADLALLMQAIGNNPHHAPSRIQQGLPAMLDLILAKALAKKVEDRYQDAAEFAADLRACAAALPASAARTVPAAEAKPAPFIAATPVEETTLDLADPAQNAGTLSQTAMARALAEAVTLPRAPATEAPGHGTTQRYTVSRKFDASATLMKLQRPATIPAEQTITRNTRRLFKSGDQLWISIAIVLAIVGAVAIALM